MKIERSQIVDTALTLLNETGVDQLTTRRLAERLGVQQPALYWHFKNKRALLDTLNEEILRRGHQHHQPARGENWRKFLLNNGRSFRRALLAYRDGARIHAGTEAQPSDLGRFEQQLEFLVASGFEVADAMQTCIAIGRYVVGCVLEEQAEQPEGPDRGPQLDAAAKDFPLISRALRQYRKAGPEGAFEAGLEIILCGAEAKLPPAGKKKVP